MTKDEIRDLIDRAWVYYAREADTYKDVTHAVLEFTKFYGELVTEARPAADEVMVQWALSYDEDRQFIALSVIADFSIVLAVPALRELADRFENSNEVSAPYDWARVNRVIGRLVEAADQQKRALEMALESAPDDRGLRQHLAELLLAGDRAQEALDHAVRLLEAEPDRLEFLMLAGRAAEAAGDADRARRYHRLSAALEGVRPTPAEDREPLAVGESISDEGSIDAFLADVLGDHVDIERPDVTLADVGGLDDVKQRLQISFLGPMRNPELRRMYGKSLRGGLLLYGPPGCGKTFVARAVAGELGAKFFGVGLHDVLEMWFGQSEQNLHKVFEVARRNAPCVLFLDEVDALGLKRSHLTHSAGRNVVVQLLSEMDSMGDDNEGVFVLGATNQPWDLDPALRRPGRFDRMLLVLPPDEAARRAIVQFHLRDRPVGGVDVGRIAELTGGYSGADLRLVCEAAAELALEASLASGTARPIGMADMQRALKDVRPSTRPWFEVARNHAMFANDDGTYDELLAYMRREKMR